jgi:hypothetical protein
MSIVQLSANRSARDEALYGAPPEESYFRTRVRRATNFSIEPIASRVQTSGLGTTTQHELRHLGDMLGATFIRTKFKQTSSNIESVAAYTINNLEGGNNQRGLAMFTHGVAHAMFREVSLLLNGATVDTHDRHSMHFDYQLFGSADKPMGELMGYRNTNLMQHEDASQPGGATYYTPLRFWFCRDPGSYLPLLAMQFTDVHLSISTEDMQRILIGASMDQEGELQSTPSSYDVFESMDVVSHYVFLDQD